MSQLRSSKLGRISAVLAALIATTSSAELWLRVDASGVLTVSMPTAQYFGPGVSAYGLVALPVWTYIDLLAEGGYTFVSRAPTSVLTQPGSFVALGLGLRGHTKRMPGALFVWLGATGDYIRTGSLNRVGWDASLGLNYVFSSGRFAIGPHVSFKQIYAIEDTQAYPTRDAAFVSIGLTFEAVVLDDARSKDRDGDGVTDDDDACPDVHGHGSADGCPADSDGDGIADAIDQCPKEPGVAAEHGCPVKADPDPDHDGVMGADDACPNVAGLAAMHGCPDADSDGVPEPPDECPTVKGLAEERGCPKYEQVRVTSEKIEILQKVYFAYGLTTILPRSFPLLKEVFHAMRDRDLCVRIEGHTDSKGNAPSNLKLSQGRAEAVRQNLVEHGIAPTRLTAKGYGATLPVDDNATSDGREHNRRVEFVIVPCRAPAP